MFRFPWGDMHSLNLGWFLQKFNELREDWATAEENITGALDAEIQRAEDALSDVFDARDAAAASATAAAGSASSAGTSATAAQNSATAAASSATLANNKATAAGLSEAAAAQSATAAAGSATQAGQSATNAAGSATAAGNSASAAAASASAAAASAASIEGDVAAADSAALKAEGFAVGQQNGVDVPSSSPYYQNNAKYYSAMAGDISIIEMTFPSIFLPLKNILSGETTTIKVTKNIVETKSGAIPRTFITGYFTDVVADHVESLYLPAGNYVTEIAILDYDNFPVTLHDSIYILDTGLSGGQNSSFYRMNLSKSGLIEKNTWYKTVQVTIPSGLYAFSTLASPDAFTNLGKIRYAFRLSKVESDGTLTRIAESQRVETENERAAIDEELLTRNTINTRQIDNSSN